MNKSKNPFKLRYSYLWAWIELLSGSLALMTPFKEMLPLQQMLFLVIPVSAAAFLLFPAFLSGWLLKYRLTGVNTLSFYAFSSLAYGAVTIILILLYALETHGITYFSPQGYTILFLWGMSGSLLTWLTSLYSILILFRLIRKRVRINN